MSRHHLAALAAAAIAVLSLTSCSGKAGEPFKDAPEGQRNTGAADTITFPDGFSNVATKCDHGNRVYVLFKGDAAYGSIAVIPNAKDCR